MPGLAALITATYDRSIARNILEMTESMCHESFYKKDVFDDGLTPLVASRVHLNVINRHPQPIYNEDSTILIMMDGELRAGNRLREKLRLAGHVIRTDSDAELILHLYEQEGEAFVNELKGWFLALICDTKTGKNLIFNDRFGIYRAYYAQQNDTLIIASEIKSILRSRQGSFGPNKDKFPEYFLYDAVLHDETLFKGIYRLPPASVWTYKGGILTKKQYFDFSAFSEQISLTKAEFDEEANRIFRKIMPAYAGDRGIGLSLTGGWDSRSALATISAMGYSVPCHTWCGPYGDSFDVKFARRAAQITGQEHHVFYIHKDFFENFADYVHKTIYISDASADVFKAHELYFNRLTRNLTPIRLTGKHGSHTMSRSSLERDLFRPYKVDRRIFSKEFIEDTGDFNDYVYIRSRDNKWIIDAIRWLWLHAYTAIETSQLVVRCPFIDEELATLLLKAPTHYLDHRSVQKFIIKKNCPSLADIPSDRGDYIRTDKVLKNIKLIALSLVCRPFERLERAYLHPAVPHSFVRLDPLMRATRLERIFLGSGLLVGCRRWMKNELKTYFESMLVDERTLSRPYLDSQFVKKMTVDHFNDKANYTREIGKIITLEMWHRLFVD